jgi:thiosulfate/3-mercaptopyruvate sulfurtransferase
VRPDYLATTGEVRRFLRGEAREACKLIDVRKAGEWSGTLLHEYPFFHKAGHLPTALYQGDWDTLMEPTTFKLGPMLTEVERRWREQGIVDTEVESGEATLIFYCGTGWRSSVSFLVAMVLGYRVKNYDDGFYGWSWHEDYEIETEDGVSDGP